MAQTNLSGLNEKQQEAVLSEGKRLLVLAGAGSGKTKTLLQKITYLIEEKGVSPSSILAITFTKNAANEMIDRLIIAADNEGVYNKILTNKTKTRAEKDKERIQYQRKYKWIGNITIKTFHSFCFSTLRNFGVNQFDNKFKLILDDSGKPESDFSSPQETSFDIFHKLLIDQCSNTEYLLSLKKYIIDYLIDEIHKEQKKNNTGYKGKFFTTLDGTKVRSKSEQYIADWLYRHNIKYEYEPLLNVKDFDFRPDFFIPAANLYIEHVSDKSFDTRDKEEQFKKGELLFVKTYERMTKDSSLFNLTLDTILKNRLPENYQTFMALSYREEFNGYYEQIKDFVYLVMQITDIIKIENSNPGEILKKALTDQHERTRTFYSLAIPLIKKYKQYCINKSYLDFNDLISETVQLLKNHQDIIHKLTDKYKYILVDEFQDVNSLQVELIKRLLTNDTTLFCVGDDWQAIYGFRGSNVGFILEFERHFPGAQVIKFDINYRSTQHIVGASNEVIRKNVFKIDKEIFATKISEHKIVVYTGNDDDDNIHFCINKITELIKEGYKREDILFLYRRNKMYTPFYEQFKQDKIFVLNKTIHAAKGLEAKIVFIIGLTDGYGGFPDIWLEDRIFQVVRKANYDLLLEEERRLFYVAITRAGEKLFLITQKGNESAFLKEIPEIYTVRHNLQPGAVVEKIIMCKKCFSQLEKLYRYCPHCGEKVI